MSDGLATTVPSTDISRVFSFVLPLVLEFQMYTFCGADAAAARLAADALVALARIAKGGMVFGINVGFLTIAEALINFGMPAVNVSGRFNPFACIIFESSEENDGAS